MHLSKNCPITYIAEWTIPSVKAKQDFGDQMFLKHPIGSGNLAPPINEERKKELTDRIRQGTLTRAEEDELVQGHTRLLLSLSQKWASQAPHLADVFVADGLYAMLVAIRKAPAKLRADKSITQYIVIHILTAFKKAVINQAVIKSPGADRKGDQTRIQNGTTYIKKKGPLLRRLGLPTDGFDSDEPEAMVQKRNVDSVLVKMVARPDRIELREILKLSTKNSWEEATLELRKYGYTLAEIAEKMGTSRKKVSDTLGIIEGRLRAMLE